MRANFTAHSEEGHQEPQTTPHDAQPSSPMAGEEQRRCMVLKVCQRHAGFQCETFTIFTKFEQCITLGKKNKSPFQTTFSSLLYSMAMLPNE